jgi:pyrroline-5-carboxylate reductase
MKSKIAFIGAGRMASAMVDGLLASDTLAPEAITVCSAHGDSARDLAERTAVNFAPDAVAAVHNADVVVVAFKPQHLAGVRPDLQVATAGKLVVSVLAAKTLAQLRTAFPQARNIIRAMPNTPSSIRSGLTGWSSYETLVTDDRETLLALFTAIGRQLEIPEEKMDALMGVSGCGPAFVFEFTAALRDGGVNAGLNESEAEYLAVQTVLGAARLMAHSDQSPESLRDQVTSPNGTTFAGLQKLTAGNFRDLIRDTVAAAKARSAELARDA